MVNSHRRWKSSHENLLVPQSLPHNRHHPLSPGVAKSANDPPLFETDVLPILTKNCMGCHGGLKQKDELDLRTLPSILKGGESGASILSGKPDESELWIQIEEDEMPKGKDKLSAEDKRVIKDWIAANMPTFAGHPDKQDDPPLPAEHRHEPLQVAETIDKQIERKLSTLSLTPVARADDEEFLRRIYLDLTGRVTTVSQVVAFLDDESDGEGKRKAAGGESTRATTRQTRSG